MAGNSPFKLLDAYEKKDKDIFFGRAEEIEALYEMAYQTNLILVYGPSGSGKTSLVQCGLANRFQPSDWFDIYIRRGQNINTALHRAISAYQVAEAEEGTLIKRLAGIKTEALTDSPPREAWEPGTELNRSLRDVFEYYLKPIYLIFDQFEELFILGNKKEQQEFYHTIADILNSEQYCRIIIILREEYLAELDAFEKVVPYLFEKRLRVEPMTRQNTNEVIVGTTEKFGIPLKDEDTASLIIDALAKGQKRVELTYLQVLLDKLFQKAYQKDPNSVAFDSQLVKRLGNIENILGEFLDNQARIIQGQLQQKHPKSPPEAVKKVLSAFVTLEGTKQPLKKEAVIVIGLDRQQIEYILDRLEKARLLRLEEGFYELSHDALAQQVAQERSEEEVALLRITKIVRDRYTAFPATNSLLNSKELRLLEVHRQQLKTGGRFRPEEWEFIRKSEWEDKRWRRIYLFGTLSLIAILTMLTIYSTYYQRVYKEQKEIATNTLDSLKIAQARTIEARYNEFLANAKKSMGDYRYADAVKELETALAFDSTGQEAIALKQEALAKLELEDEFNRLIAEGDSLFNQGETTYLNALEKYREAVNLDFNTPLAKAKESQAREKLGSAFEKLKTAGDAFFDGKGYKFALNAYRQAARIRPSDPYIQARIAECQQKMGGR